MLRIWAAAGFGICWSDLQPAQCRNWGLMLFLKGSSLYVTGVDQVG